MSENNQDEDIITIHLGRVVSEELYDQIVKDIVRLLEQEQKISSSEQSGKQGNFLKALLFQKIQSYSRKGSRKEEDLRRMTID